MVADRHLADAAGAIREIRRAQITRGLTAREPPETVYTLYTEAIIAVACAAVTPSDALIARQLRPHLRNG